MPQFPPNLANLSSPVIKHWIPPRSVKIVNPSYAGNLIYLPSMPTVWYEAYNWSTGVFRDIGSTPAFSQYLGTNNRGPYEPVRLEIEGIIVPDKTNYTTLDIPTLSDYTTTRRIEYYLDGKRLVTNVDINTMSLKPDSIIVTYSVTCDRLRLIVDMWQDGTNETGKGVAIDSYQLSLFEGLHPAHD